MLALFCKASPHGLLLSSKYIFGKGFGDYCTQVFLVGVTSRPGPPRDF
jgi:hypothetical protein